MNFLIVHGKSYEKRHYPEVYYIVGFLLFLVVSYVRAPNPPAGRCHIVSNFCDDVIMDGIWVNSE